MKNNVWILGPCSMENEELYLSTAQHLAKIMAGRDWYYKASFDKANRTSLHGGRGPGLEYALEMFRKVKEEVPGIKLLTDVHETHQVAPLAEEIDCIQVPAFLSRQTDLIVECAKHFNKINIKKMQHLGPNNLIKSVDKIKETNSDCEAWICDRGTNFGYDKLFVDYTIVDELKRHYDKVLLDCTHATQRSKAVHGIQGDRVLAEKYLATAGAFGYDGVFAETHPEPDTAVSDGDCQIYLHRMEGLVSAHDRITNIFGENA